MASATKAEGAFLTIGELAEELGLPHHILRYWETRFPQLKPLQRAGNRRYYRPEDAQMAREINRLLYQDGYTVKGVQKLLGIMPVPDSIAPVRAPEAEVAPADTVPPVPPPHWTEPDMAALPIAAPAPQPQDWPKEVIEPLRAVRARLAQMLSDLEALA